ncbi:hypothetical protein HY989_02360 [Candidatus Micrarchaeota archaeon]|nr:hypothetical protein [Candidatus Micrarchaeota archaeon]
MGIILIPFSILLAIALNPTQYKFQLDVLAVIISALAMFILTATLVKSVQVSNVQILFQCTKQVQESERDLVLFQQSGVKDKKKEKDLVNLMLNNVELGLFSMRSLDVSERDESLSYFDGLLLNWRIHIEKNQKIRDDPSAFKEIKKRLIFLSKGEKMEKPKQIQESEDIKRDSALNLLALFLTAVLVLFSENTVDDKYLVYFFTFSFVTLFYFIFSTKNKEAISDLFWVLKQLTWILAIVFLSLTFVFMARVNGVDPQAWQMVVPYLSTVGFAMLFALIVLFLDASAIWSLVLKREKLPLFSWIRSKLG